jgi:uncharacterized protein (TIGR02588 family)
MTQKAQQGSSEHQVPLLEWIAAGLGVAILLAMFAFLALEALGTSSSQPPSLRIEPVGLAAAGEQFIVEVKVSNRSAQTGAGVQFEGSLSQAGKEVETSSATIDYVPGNSERRAGLIFTRDPRIHQAQFRVTGYQRP